MVLILSAGIMDVICQVSNTPIGLISILAVALFGILVAGMADFYERATIAMYLHIECPPTDKDLTEVKAALNQSAKGIGLVSS
jgi:predicted amino acid-binding ACT domain protein